MVHKFANNFYEITSAVAYAGVISSGILDHLVDHLASDLDMDGGELIGDIFIASESYFGRVQVVFYVGDDKRYARTLLCIAEQGKLLVEMGLAARSEAETISKCRGLSEAIANFFAV